MAGRAVFGDGRGRDLPEGRRGDGAGAGSRGGSAVLQPGLGHRLKWRNDAVGQAGLELPDGDSELVLTTRQSYQPNWLVDRVDDAVEFLTGHGGGLVAAPFDIPVGRAAVVRDPFGNTLVLVDLSKGTYTPDGAGAPTG